MKNVFSFVNTWTEGKLCILYKMLDVKYIFVLLFALFGVRSQNTGKNPICLLPLDRGLQQAAVGPVQRWFYNKETDECEEFTFIPAGGNKNNFNTYDDCALACKSSGKCPLGNPLKDRSGKELFCGFSPTAVQCPNGSWCLADPADRFAKCCPMCPQGQPLLNRTGSQINCGRSSDHQDCPTGSSCVIDPADRYTVCCKDSQTTPRKCPTGQPLTTSNGKEIFCGMGPSHQNCPKGYHCVIDPADAFAVCCKNSDLDNKQCPNGQPLINSTTGVEVFCGRGPTRQACPKGYQCVIDPADRFAVCCKNSDSESKKCPSGQPLMNNTTGLEVFCGRGPTRQDCPNGYQCIIDPADRFAVCCTSSDSEIKKCPRGQPLINSTTGLEVFCGRGPTRQECPKSFQCIIDPADRFAVCCRDNRCPRGIPLTNSTTGVELFCGDGPSSQQCPRRSQCVVHPADAFAVCCPN